MSPEDDPDDEDGPPGLIRSLLALLEEMEAHGERRRSGFDRLGRTSFEYSIDIGGLDSLEDERPSERRVERDASRTSATPSGPDPDAHVTTRETGDGIVLAADLPGVESDDDDVETWLDRESEVLVVQVDGRDVATLPIDDDGWTVTGSRFSNGVLEVTLHRD